MEKRSFLQSSNPRRLTPMLFFACLIGAAALVATMTQGQQGPPAKNPAGAKQAQQTTGWLILDGCLIPGPYAVVVKDSSVEVNEIAVILPPPERKKATPVQPSPIHALNRALTDSFSVWNSKEGIEAARLRALSFMKRQALVDTAYFDGDATLKVRYHGRAEEESFWLCPPEEPTTTGWLILDGALIPGPYEVEAGESTISVNGVVAVARPPRNKPSPSTTPTSSTHAANRALYDTFLVWYAMHGIDSARQRALDFISVHELVDTAYLEGIKLQVKYKTEDTFEGFLLSPPEDDHESTEQVLRENLAMLAARLQMHLTSGSLVFLKRSGGYHAIPSPRAAEVLNQLLELARAELSIDARMVAIRKLIGDEEMAKAIARSLGK